MTTIYNERTRETILTDGEFTVRMWGESSDDVSAYGSHVASHDEEIIVHGVTREEADAAAIAWLEDQPQ
jgi:hypothetical protein